MNADAVSRNGARRLVLLTLYAGGIYSAYLTQGYVQEALATTTYVGPEGAERFPHLEALNGAQCVACSIFSGLLLLISGWDVTDASKSRQDGRADVASPLEYWRPALTNSIGPACGIVALKSISYPAQVCYPTAASTIPIRDAVQGHLCVINLM